MEIKELNELLKNLQNPDKAVLKLIKIEKGHQGVPENDGYQGEYNEIFRIYQILSSPELFLKITYNTDSYGINEFPVSIQITKAKEKKITVYEYE